MVGFLSKTPRIYVALALFLLVLLFTRLYNLEKTARFTQDESSDLVRMHQYIIDKKITLIGPISNDNTKVFGSLTYYMLIPFVALGKSDPISPVYGTAFWGILTALLFVLLTWKINKKYLWLTAVLVLIWYPLVETSRWAWNPHYVTFWIALGILIYQLKWRWSYLWTGIFLALAFHNHYLAVIATGTFVALSTLELLLIKKWKQAVELIVGFLLPFSAFVIFDLRHPPGLFFGKYLSAGETPHLANEPFISVFEKVAQNIVIAASYLSGPGLVWLLITLIAILLILERKQLKTWLWMAPVMAQIVVGSVLDVFQTRYFLPALVFFFVWLIQPREGFNKIIAQACLVVCILGSSFTIIPQLTKTKVPPDIYSLREATNYIAQTYTENNLKNSNIMALSSSDSDPLGAKYRDLLRIKDIHFRAASQYDTSEQLFVVSTSDIGKIYTDASFPKAILEKGELHEIHYIPDSRWKVYWFSF